MGFCVAKTKNGSSSVYVRPCTVTRCSCIASSSADCVLGGVRLISSARTMLPKMGPGTNTILRWPVAGSSCTRSVPVMSLGIRSGVNWMRENLRSSTLAIVRMRSVFARPGTPTIRLLPPTKSDRSTWSTTASWPTICFLSSATMRFRPSRSRSARATSSAASSPCCVEVMSLAWSVRHGVDEIVYAELVVLVGQVDGDEPRVRPLPRFADVVVVVHDHQHALRGVVVLEDPKVLRWSGRIGRLPRQRIDLEERVKYRVRGRELDRLRIRKDPMQVVEKVLHHVAAAHVV